MTHITTQANLNAQPHPSPEEFAAHVAAFIPPGAFVWASKSEFGAPDSQVPQSTLTANNLYWLNVALNEAAHTLDFVVTFTAGSPLTTQRQSFVFSGSGYGGVVGNRYFVSTPFGVPSWGNNLILGPAVLTVLADGQLLGTFPFSVVS